MTDLIIRPAVVSDVPVILQLIHGLAEYERAPERWSATRRDCANRYSARSPMPRFSWPPSGKCRAGFAVFFHNYSTWWGRRGLYP